MPPPLFFTAAGPLAASCPGGAGLAAEGPAVFCAKLLTASWAAWLVSQAGIDINSKADAETASETWYNLQEGLCHRVVTAEMPVEIKKGSPAFSCPVYCLELHSNAETICMFTSYLRGW